MKAILFYQHAVRELESCKRLRDLLRKRDLDAEIIQIDFDWVRAVRIAKQVKVDVVIMPWLYSDGNYALLYPFFNVNPNLVVVNLHHEQISTPAYEPILLPTGNASKFGCYHIAWGDFFASKLVSKGVPKELIKVAGNMRTDDVIGQNNAPDKSGMAKEFGLDDSKRWLLYAENRGWVYKFSQSYRYEYESQGVASVDIDRNMSVSIESLERTYEQISKLDDKFASEFELIYRPHPGTTTPFEGGGCVHVIGERAISDWIANIDALVTWSSTSAYEAEMAGVPVVRHSAIDCPEDLMIYGMSGFISIGCLNDITPELLSNIRARSTHHIYESFYGTVDGRATERVADAIIESAYSGMLEKPRYVLSLEDRRLLIRKCLFEAAAKASAETGLLKKLHWPRSAFYQCADLPYKS